MSVQHCNEGQRDNLPSVAIRSIVNNIHTDANRVHLERGLAQLCKRETRTTLPPPALAPVAQSHQVKLIDVHIQAGHGKKQMVNLDT